MNALLREMKPASFSESKLDGIIQGKSGSFFVIPLRPSGAEILVEITHRSSVGQHGFGGLFLRRESSVEPVDFPQVLSLLVKAPGVVGDSTPREQLTFLLRVLESAAAIGDILDDSAPACPADERDPRFIEAEQGLRFGHSVHPAPRSRGGFQPGDAQRYAPEHGGGFPLHWWAVAPAALVHDSAADRSVPELIRSLIASDPLLEREIGSLGSGKVPVPMHPWQAARLVQSPEVRRLFEAGLVEDLGVAGSPWQPTSSLRTLWAEHAPWMLKVSIGVRLTNSVRTIEMHELDRGKEVFRLLNGPAGDELRRLFPQFRILGEPAHLALIGPDGTPLAATAVAFRENPFVGTDQPSAAVLATLCEIDPDGTGSRLADIVRRIAAQEGAAADAVAIEWFETFLSIAVEPFLVAATDYGLLFGAHQQNLVLGLSEGRPVTLYYRDSQGTGYVRDAREGPVPSTGNVFAPDTAWPLVGYYLMINAVFAVIGALATARLATEDTLIAVLRRFLERLAAVPGRDPALISYLLTSPTLSAKRNFMLTFRSINENTEVRNPLAAYVEIPNPMAGAR